MGIKDLSKRILNKSFDPKLIKNMSDEEAIEYLSNLRQIGRWSAEMVLLFTYNRPNIWPVQDIGLLRQFQIIIKKNIYRPKDLLNIYKKNFHLIVQLLRGIFGGVLILSQYNIRCLQ